MNVSYPFIRRPVGTSLLAIGLFLVGIVAYGFLPVASMPTVEYPTIRVTASRPGADPRIMASTVAAPLERRLGQIPGVVEITSIEFARQHPHHHSVRSRPQYRRRGARRAGRPECGAERPAGRPADAAAMRKVNPSASPIMILALTSQTMPPSAMYDVADSVIAQRISQVDGVAEVTVSGSEQPAIRIRVNPVAIASMGVSMEDVRLAVARRQ